MYYTYFIYHMNKYENFDDKKNQFGCDLDLRNTHVLGIQFCISLLE
jgi:hypothetical protein